MAERLSDEELERAIGVSRCGLDMPADEAATVLAELREHRATERRLREYVKELEERFVGFVDAYEVADELERRLGGG